MTLAHDECPSCGLRWTVPRTGCPRCGAAPRRLSASGLGTVAAVSVVHPASGEPYVLVLVDLDEGVRAMGRARSAVPIGTRVRAGLEDGRPTFAPDGA
ncbi:OB-fold domain-containing protein [Actinomycetospora lutea]|uniref:Zn-ribbon domain-containing OB-fold protein n=1 Tax=Actinomycetospora lutea TaxID=663604 RepID=UPI00236629D0|nr:OB-fold domain-containing protein [Actinomycetospora lutea]MDD7938331.1 OB-fold domain-containing protein [Actinomycetospora lutea]